MANEFTTSGIGIVGTRFNKLLDDQMAIAKKSVPTASDWETKTASFTAEAGGRYIVDVTAGAVTMTMPTTYTVGDMVQVAVPNGANGFLIDPGVPHLDGFGAGAGAQAIGSNTALSVMYLDTLTGWITEYQG